MTSAKIIDFIEKHQRKILYLAMLFIFSFIVIVGFIKYRLNLYNALDLAYFNQVFWNTVRGNWFVQTIHPQLSLGDHAEFIIPLLAIPYAIFQDARTLIALQAAALVLPAVLIYRICQPNFSQLTPLTIALIYLFSPLILNIGLYEFHILTFALIPIFLAIEAYLKGKKLQFLIYIFLAMLVREDVALIIAGFSLLAWIEEKNWFWKIMPALCAGIYFLIALKIIAMFSLTNGYKFQIYYGWLGNNGLDMIKNVFLHPLRVYYKIFSMSNLQLIMGLAMSFAFIPFFAKKYWALLALPFLEFALGSGASTIVMQTHYAVLFIPGLVMATIDGWPKMHALLKKLPPPPVLILSTIVAFMAIYFGPYLGIINLAKNYKNLAVKSNDAAQLINMTPPNASVATGYGTLTNLSARPNLYSLHYIALGVTQFAETKYEVPKNLEYSLLDSTELLAYKIQFSRESWTKPYAPEFIERLKKAVGEPVAIQGDYVLFNRTASLNNSNNNSREQLRRNARVREDWLLELSKIKITDIKNYELFLNNLGSVEVRKLSPQ